MYKFSLLFFSFFSLSRRYGEHLPSSSDIIKNHLLTIIIETEPQAICLCATTKLNWHTHVYDVYIYKHIDAKKNGKNGNAANFGRDRRTRREWKKWLNVIKKICVYNGVTSRIGYKINWNEEFCYFSIISNLFF